MARARRSRSGPTRPKQSARPGSRSARVTELELAWRIEQAYGADWTSYLQMAGSAQSSAAPRFFWCCSFDPITREPRLDGPGHSESLVDTRAGMGVGAWLYAWSLIHLSPRTWISIVCLLKKLMGPFDEATNISMVNGSTKSHAPIAPQLFHFRPSSYTSLLLENLHNYHGFA